MPAIKPKFGRTHSTQRNTSLYTFHSSRPHQVDRSARLPLARFGHAERNTMVAAKIWQPRARAMAIGQNRFDSFNSTSVLTVGPFVRPISLPLHDGDVHRSPVIAIQRSFLICRLRLHYLTIYIYIIYGWTLSPVNLVAEVFILLVEVTTI